MFPHYAVGGDRRPRALCCRRRPAAQDADPGGQTRAFRETARERRETVRPPFPALTLACPRPSAPGPLRSLYCSWASTPLPLPLRGSGKPETAQLPQRPVACSQQQDNSPRTPAPKTGVFGQAPAPVTPLRWAGPPQDLPDRSGYGARSCAPGPPLHARLGRPQCETATVPNSYGPRYARAHLHPRRGFARSYAVRAGGGKVRDRETQRLFVVNVGASQFMVFSPYRENPRSFHAFLSTRGLSARRSCTGLEYQNGGRERGAL